MKRLATVCTWLAPTLLWLVLYGGTACAATAPTDATDAAAASDPVVEEVREGLDSGWFSPPWYDRSRDDLRRISVRERNPWFDWDPNWNWNFGLPSMTLVQWLAWLLVALLLAFICYILIRAYLRRQPGAALAAGAGDQSVVVVDDEARVEALPFRVERQATDLLEAARMHYQAGNLREAIIYLFSHQLVELDKHQMIRLTKGKTNRQYLREVKSRPRLRELLESTMVSFEAVFFGNHSLEREQFERHLAQWDEFDKLLRQVPS